VSSARRSDNEGLPALGPHRVLELNCELRGHLRVALEIPRAAASRQSRPFARHGRDQVLPPGQAWLDDNRGRLEVVPVLADWTTELVQAR